MDIDAFNLKAEAIHLPDQVVAGEPVTVHYRVGNVGRTSLPDTRGAVVRLYARSSFERTDFIAASDGRWEAGASYHTGEPTAISASTSIGEVTPFEITFGSAGLSWVFIAVVTYDDTGEEVGFHGIWHDLIVLSGPTFGPVTVKVDGLDYQVVAEADADGIVTTAVSSVADPDAEVDSSVRAKAIYAAGVRTQVLDGIFERPAIAALSGAEEPAPVNVENPSSSTLLKAFAAQYAGAVAASGLADVLTAGEAIAPVRSKRSRSASPERHRRSSRRWPRPGARSRIRSAAPRRCRSPRRSPSSPRSPMPRACCLRRLRPARSCGRAAKPI